MNNATRMLGMLTAAAALAAGSLGPNMARAEEKQYLIVAKGDGFSDDRHDFT